MTDEPKKAAAHFVFAGKKPPRKKEILPKPKKALQAREAPLNLDKNLNKTIIVNSSGPGPGQPGFYCDICKRTSKDSAAYLSHVNGRSHLRRLGQTTKVKKSTLNQVRLKIAELREATNKATQNKQYDFEKRLKEIREGEKQARIEAREAKKQRKQGQTSKAAQPTTAEDADMMAAMGFASFGGVPT